jgi:hypothetical protein
MSTPGMYSFLCKNTENSNKNWGLWVSKDAEFNNLKQLHHSHYLPPKKFETVKSLFSQLSLLKVTVIRCRYSTEFKKETVKSLNF